MGQVESYEWVQIKLIRTDICIWDEWVQIKLIRIDICIWDTVKKLSFEQKIMCILIVLD